MPARPGASTRLGHEVGRPAALRVQAELVVRALGRIAEVRDVRVQAANAPQQAVARVALPSLRDAQARLAVPDGLEAAECGLGRAQVEAGLARSIDDIRGAIRDRVVRLALRDAGDLDRHVARVSLPVGHGEARLVDASVAATPPLAAEVHGSAVVHQHDVVLGVAVPIRVLGLVARHLLDDHVIGRQLRAAAI
jgi:hypothetical protein